MLIPNLTQDERRAVCIELWDRWACAVSEQRRDEAPVYRALHRKILKNADCLSEQELDLVQDCLLHPSYPEERIA